MGLVLGQDHRTVGQRGKGGLDVDDDLVGVGAPLATSRGLRQAATSPTRGAGCAGLRLVGRGTGTAAGSSTPWVGQAGGGSAHPAADCPAATAQRGAGRPVRWRPAGCSGAPSGAPCVGRGPAARRSWLPASAAGSRIMTSRSHPVRAPWPRLMACCGTAVATTVSACQVVQEDACLLVGWLSASMRAARAGPSPTRAASWACTHRPALRAALRVPGIEVEEVSM
jgi:hypothetical protein